MIVANGRLVVRQKVLEGRSEMEIKDKVTLTGWKKWLGMVEIK